MTDIHRNAFRVPVAGEWFALSTCDSAAQILKVTPDAVQFRYANDLPEHTVWITRDEFNRRIESGYWF